MITRRLLVSLLTAASLFFAVGAEAQIASGTVNAKQSGTWSITNISGTISLPTGAATSAKQPALGTAGSASADVITIQGIASMTPILVNGSGVTQPVSGTVTANQGSNNATPWNENIAQINGVTPLMGAGNTGTGSLRVTIATDQATLPVTQGALSTIVTGQQAVTASAVALPSNTAKRVCLKVLTGGTQVVYFGTTGVATTTGQELSPGDSWCGPIANSSSLVVIAASTGSTVAYDILN